MKTIADWWQSPLGEVVLGQEAEMLQAVNQYFTGYYQLQLGSARSLLPVTTRAKQQKIMAKTADFEGLPEGLPIKCHSIDLVLLTHVLEFSDNPHQVLREAERVLVADGTLVLCCFNPFSLWGLRRLLSWQDCPPWQGKFFRQTRIKDWLSLLNFDVIATKRLVFSPPIQSAKWLGPFAFMERWGRRLWAMYAGVTILIASKRTVPLIPVTRSWQLTRLFPSRPLTGKAISREYK